MGISRAFEWVADLDLVFLTVLPALFGLEPYVTFLLSIILILLDLRKKKDVRFKVSLIYTSLRLSKDGE